MKTGTSVKLKLNGMCNLFRREAVPDGKAYTAVNVNYTNTGEIVFPRQGSTSAYAGVVQSLSDNDNGIFFLEDGELKLLENGVATAVMSGLGTNAVSYTRPIADRIYFSNGTVRGRYNVGDLAASTWGTPVPTAEPTVSAISTGGMSAGTYRVVTTWIAAEESGAGNGVSVEVPEGGGIQLTGFPVIPAGIDYIGVYVSSVNGKDMYLYDEYSNATTTVTITQKICTIPLLNQFCYPPAPAAGSVIIDHYGRIYYSDGSLLRYTHIDETGPRYDLEADSSFFRFDSDIQTIVSCPGVLYVSTENAFYKVGNIDAPDDSAPIVEQLQACGGVKGSECYHNDGVAGYFMSHRGLIKCTPEGLQELTYTQCALPIFASGSSTILYEDGRETLVFVGKDGTKNVNANKDYNDVEWASAATQDSQWGINLATGAVSKYTGYGFANVSGNYGANTDGIFELLGDTDNGAIISAYVESGNTDFGLSEQKRLHYFYADMDGGKLKLTITDESYGAVNYDLLKTTKQRNAKATLAYGAKGRHWTAKLANVNGSKATVYDMETDLSVLSRRI